MGFSGMTSRVHQSAGLGKASSPLTSLCLEHLAPFNPSVLTLESAPGSALLPKLWPLSVSTATVADSCHHSCYNLRVFPPRPPAAKALLGRISGVFKCLMSTSLLSKNPMGSQLSNAFFVSSILERLHLLKAKVQLGLYLRPRALRSW